MNCCFHTPTDLSKLSPTLPSAVFAWSLILNLKANHSRELLLGKVVEEASDAYAFGLGRDERRVLPSRLQTQPQPSANHLHPDSPEEAGLGGGKVSLRLQFLASRQQCSGSSVQK
ncbi:hypothetical protein MHYP_G00057970 [Metynnis hypsauchen]